MPDVVLSLDPDTDTIFGGSVLSIAGNGFQAAAAADDFLDGSISAAWDTTGIVTERAGAIILDSGTTDNGDAVLASADAFEHLDVRMTFTIVLSEVAAHDISTLAALDLVVDAGTSLQFSLDSDGSVRLRSEIAGIFQPTLRVVAGQFERTARLRLLRVGPKVYAFLNDTLVFQTLWALSAVTFAARVQNGASGGHVVSAVTNYVRVPVVQLGSVVVTDVQVLSDRLLVAVVPPSARAGVVDATVYLLEDPAMLSTSFTYTLPDSLLRIGKLVVTNDRVLTRRVPA